MQHSQTRYEDTIPLGIGDTDLSLVATLVPPTRTQGILTIGRLQGNTEDVYYTNVVGNTVTISLRGLSETALTPTQVVGNRKVHNANESLEITTHHLYDTNKARKDENDTISGDWEFTGTETFADDKARSKTTAAPVDDKSFANKKYVDDQVGGVADTKVKVSSDDTTTDFLDNKFTVSGGLVKTVTSPGGNEKINLHMPVADFLGANMLGSTPSLVYVDRQCLIGRGFTTSPAINVSLSGSYPQYRSPRSDYADADVCDSFVLIGDYLYVLILDSGTTPNTYRVYRYSATNINAGGALMNFAGSFVLVQTDSSLRMSSDGTYLYFNFKAGNSANDYDVAKFEISGTTLNYVSTTSFGSTSGDCGNVVFTSNAAYGFNNGSGYLTKISKFDLSGTLISSGATSTGAFCQYNYLGNIYIGRTIDDQLITYTKIVLP